MPSKKRKGVTRLPNCLPYSEVKRILCALGAREERAEGNHAIFVREKDGRTYVAPVPLAAGRDIPQGTLGSIWRLMGVSKKEVLQAYAGTLTSPTKAYATQQMPVQR